MHGDDIPLNFELEALEDLSEMVFGVSIYQKGGCWLVEQTSREAGVIWPSAKKGQIVSGQWINESPVVGPSAIFVSPKADLIRQRILSLREIDWLRLKSQEQAARLNPRRQDTGKYKVPAKPFLPYACGHSQEANGEGCLGNDRGISSTELH